MNETIEPKTKTKNVINNSVNETFEPKPKQKKKLTKLILLLISYIILALIVWKVATKQVSDPIKQQEQAQKELTTIVEAARKIMILPNNETPQVAIIQDVDALKKTQDFFVDAENGDKILVYPQARKAVIYREKTNQIVNVALNIGPVTDETNSTPVQDTPKAPAATASTTNEQ